MTYEEIIRENSEYRRICPVQWWPQFAFHFTDVTNAAGILDTGFIYSRTKAEDLGLMQNDNASRKVIDMTRTAAISCARFYFRPLTPTQFHNEGYKHPALRYEGDRNANIPVPVFFLFDLATLLSMPGVLFSECGQSGHGCPVLHGPEEFASLPFNKIYSVGQIDPDDMKYRHAEITHPNAFPIDGSLRRILCRNEVERVTLLQLLRERDYVTFAKYKNIIRVYNDDVFYNNGLFISDCRYYDNSLTISFSDNYPRREHIRYLSRKGKDISESLDVTMNIELEWVNNKGVIDRKTTEVHVDYMNPGTILLQHVPALPSSRFLNVRIFIDGKLMAFLAFSTENMELIK